MEDAKKRHGCLTAWLVLMFVGNSAAALIYLLGIEGIRQRLPNMTLGAFSLLIVMFLFNLVCVIALFKWKKWGFWGACASTIVTTVVNISTGLGIGAFWGGVISVAILYGVLQIGEENQGWTQLD
jgi:MFS superfamily sulfate permease-like transporter